MGPLWLGICVVIVVVRMRGFAASSAHVRILEDDVVARAILDFIMRQNRAYFWRNTGGVYTSNDLDVARWQAGLSGARGQLEFTSSRKQKRTLQMIVHVWLQLASR